jgi:hypothetical protein
VQYERACDALAHYLSARVAEALHVTRAVDERRDGAGGSRRRLTGVQNSTHERQNHRGSVQRLLHFVSIFVSNDGG